jgi:hypothetical protein
MAISKMVGAIDGNEIIFRKDSSGFWTAAVPKDLSGEFIVEVIAYDDAGNQAYSSNMLFIVDPYQLGVQIMPLEYAYRVLDENFNKKSIVSEYAYYVTDSIYKFKELPAKYTFKVVS